jgi:hypothetical protein
MYDTLLSRAVDNDLSANRLYTILQLEPRIDEILSRAAFLEITPTYNRLRAYHQYRVQLEPLIGWHAENPSLRTADDYQLILHALFTLLPPDEPTLLEPHPPFP